MLFNSIEFAIFLPLVFFCYWFIFRGNLKHQNMFVLLASYVFYGWWDWRFLSLIVISSIIDYLAGKKLAEVPDSQTGRRKALLVLSLFSNLSMLGFFKYFNFFIANLADAFTIFGIPFSGSGLNIVLPVGISFYTFQTLSYTIDVYRRKIEPTHDWIEFFAFVSFFPQLVAGPIERARDLLPQFSVKRVFCYASAVDGMRQMLWGFFKKIVLADQCGIYVNEIFANHSNFSGSTILLASVFFAFQIYGDFSGYSDIAIGTARLFGFRLSRNFHYPYFARDIAEFWRRWHISLTTWFRDYLYIPLGGSRVTKTRAVVNTFVVFLVSGFWHGANWTFIAWGALNAILFLPLLLAEKNRAHTGPVAPGKWLPGAIELLKMLTTFFFVCLTWVVFRSENLTQATQCLVQIFSWSLFHKCEIWPQEVLKTIGFVVLVEWLQRDRQHGLEDLKFSRIFRWLLYLLLSVYCVSLVNFKSEFVYFQF